MIPVHLRAVLILPSWAKRVAFAVLANILPFIWLIVYPSLENRHYPTYM